jgi:hypothetical protein
VEFFRGRVRRDVSGDDAVHVFRGEGGEERGIELRAQAAAGRFRCAIDGGFDGAAVGGLGAKARGAGVAEDDSVFFGDEEAMTAGFRKLREPFGALGDGLRLEVEGGRGCEDVVVVDFGEAWEIGGPGGADERVQSADLLSAQTIAGRG